MRLQPTLLPRQDVEAARILKGNSMLVLARDAIGRSNHGPEQDIVVICPDGRRVTFTLLSIAGNRARIGVTAPRQYEILRGEILEIPDE